MCVCVLYYMRLKSKDSPWNKLQQTQWLSDLVAWRLGLCSNAATAAAKAECLAPGSTKANVWQNLSRWTCSTQCHWHIIQVEYQRYKTSAVAVAADDDAEQSQSQGVMIAWLYEREWSLLYQINSADKNTPWQFFSVYSN